MQKYSNNVQDQYGNAIPSVTVTIRDNPGGSLSTIYSDNGVTPKSNPFTNDSDGEFFFYAANGHYDVEFSGPITDSIDDIRLLDTPFSAVELTAATDADAADPPTTEAMNGGYYIYDNEQDTILGFLGYTGANDLYLINYMQEGIVGIQAVDSAGTTRTILSGDPDATTVLRADTNLELQVAAGETALLATANGATSLYYDNVAKLRTADESAADGGMGAEVLHADGSFYPVGMNVIPPNAGLDSGNVTLAQGNVGHRLTYNSATARSLLMNDDANIKVGAAWSLHVGPSAGTLTGDGGTGVVIRYWNGTGWAATAAAGNITIGVGDYTIWKETDTLYHVNGPTIS